MTLAGFASLVSASGYLFGLVLLVFGACFSFVRMIWVSTTER